MLKFYWQITRPINLLLTLLTQLLFYFSASRTQTGISWIQIENIRFPEALTATLACIFIAAGGYVINDIFDIETDAINKPKKQIAASKIPVSQLKLFYYTLSLIGVLFGFFTGLGMGILCIAIAVLLYYYSSDFKGEYLMGNLMVSLLAGMVVYIASRGVFEVSKAYFAEFSSIAFFVTFARELIKDLEDLEGDKAQGYQTFALSMGAKYTKILATLFIILSLSLLGLIYWHGREIAFLIASLLITLPLCMKIIWALKSAQDAQGYRKISNDLKWLMFLGLFTCLLC